VSYPIASGTVSEQHNQARYSTEVGKRSLNHNYTIKNSNELLKQTAHLNGYIYCNCINNLGSGLFSYSGQLQFGEQDLDTFFE